MKKIIAALVFTAIFLGGCFLTYDYYYGGSDYYTVINGEGEHDTEVSDEGVVENIYRYTQTAYSASGDVKTVKMNEHRSAPLKEGAYLKLLVNPNKVVISWEEVSEEDVPQAALEKLTPQ